jgi:hypothetical protein
MNVADAKALVLGLMGQDLRRSGAAITVDPRSPDPRDPGKFLLDGAVARVVHHYGGSTGRWTSR